MELGKID